MRILCIDKHETNAGWGAECFLGEALQAAGVSAQHLDYERQRGRVAAALQAEPAFHEVDAVLVQRGTGYVFPPRLLDAFRVPRILLLTELVARARALEPLLRSGRFEHVFVRTPTCKAALVERGWVAAKAVDVFLSACPEPYLREGATPPDEDAKDIDVLWVGSVLPRRRRILDELARTVPVTEARAFGADMVALVRRARVVLNLHAEERLDTETRVYEVLGAGGFLVSEPLSAESPFEPDRHYVESASPSALAQQVRAYLTDPKRRNTIAAAGHFEVRARHTYAARAAQVLAVLRTLSKTREPGRNAVDLGTLQAAAVHERKRARRAAVLAPLRRAAAKLRGR